MAMRKVLAVLALAAAAGGCGDGDPFDYVPVSGRLTYDDGTPIPASGIRIGFTVQDVAPIDGKYPRPAEAVVDAEGNFANCTSVKYGDGLLPGKHKAAIYYATDAKGKLLIPKEYAHAATTPLVISTETLPLEIKVPRP
jgi:hypothetical protein